MNQPILNKTKRGTTWSLEALLESFGKDSKTERKLNKHDPKTCGKCKTALEVFI